MATGVVGSAVLARPRRRSVPTGERVTGGVSQAVLIACAVVVVLPFLWTFMSSFKTSAQVLQSPFTLPDTLHVENYVNAWTKAGIGTFFVNTLLVVGGALVLTMVLGSMCAYFLARYGLAGAEALAPDGPENLDAL